MSDLAVRLWLGWRSNELLNADKGWEVFKKNLAHTFIPATWEIMKGYKLNTYVPSIFLPLSIDGFPEEVALLCYQTKEDYDASNDQILGRSYRIMHRAIFEFREKDRVSTAKWCAEGGEDVPILKSAANGGALFNDSNSIIHVALLSTPKGDLSAQKILDRLSHYPGNIAVWHRPRYCVVWLAASETLDQTDIETIVKNTDSEVIIKAFHKAVSSPEIDQEKGIPVVENHSWHFSRSFEESVEILSPPSKISR
jgi:hypothetical protein